MTERKAVAKCCICSRLSEGQGKAYRKVGLFKPKYAHEVCLQIKKAMAMASYATLSSVFRC
jgi:hypothetical protein